MTTASPREQSMQCLLCHDELQQPVVLACFHAFCSPCLLTRAGAAGMAECCVRCPRCEVACAMADAPQHNVCPCHGDPAQMRAEEASANENTDPGVRLLDSLLLPDKTDSSSKPSETERCQSCSIGGQACAVCFECGPICVFCRKCHETVRAFSSHLLVDLAAHPPTCAPTDTSRCCATHDSFELTLFCDDCSLPVCVECRSDPLHSAHAIAPLDEAVRSRKSRVLTLLRVSAKRRHDAETAVGDARDRLARAEADTRERVERLKGRLQDTLLQVVRELENRIAAHFETRRTAVDALAGSAVKQEVGRQMEFVEQLFASPLTPLTALELIATFETRLREAAAANPDPATLATSGQPVLVEPDLCGLRTVLRNLLEPAFGHHSSPGSSDDDLQRIEDSPDNSIRLPVSGAGSWDRFRAFSESCAPAELAHFANRKSVAQSCSLLGTADGFGGGFSEGTVSEHPVRRKTSLQEPLGRPDDFVGVPLRMLPNANQPAVPLTVRIAKCTGGVLGHAAVFINMEKPGIHACNQCGQRFYNSDTIRPEDLFVRRDDTCVSEVVSPPMQTTYSQASSPFQQPTAGSAEDGGGMEAAGGGGVPPTHPGYPEPSSTALPSLIQRCRMSYSAKMGGFGVLEGQFTEPSGLAVTPEGDVVIADTNNHRIQIFDTHCMFKFQFGSPGKRDGQLLYPNRVAVNPTTGDFVITERSPTHQVQIFDKEGNFVRKFGTNILQHPRGVCVDQEGRVIIVECKLMRVCIFSPTGTLLFKFNAVNHLLFPNNICVGRDQELLICDNRDHCVKVFSYNGAFLRKIGGEGLTNYPIGVALGLEGEILVVDNHNNFNLTMFDQFGNLLRAFESKVRHAHCFDVALHNGTVIVASKDYKIYFYNYAALTDGRTDF